MRYLVLLIAAAIVFYAYSRRVQQSGMVEEANAEFAATAPAEVQRAAPAAPAAPPSAPAPSSGLRRPIDNTRSVLEKVKKRNGNGEF